MPWKKEKKPELSLLGEDTAQWSSANQTANMLTSLSGAAQCPELEKWVLLFTNYVVCGITFQLLLQVPGLLMGAGDWIQASRRCSKCFTNRTIGSALSFFLLIWIPQRKKKRDIYLSEFGITHSTIPPSVHIFPIMSRLLTTAKDHVWVPFKLLLYHIA